MLQPEIAMPFRLSASGGIQVVTNTDAQVQQHVMSVVNTEPGERVMLPTYGVRLASLLFEEIDDIRAETIADQVAGALLIWEPGVRLTRAVPVRGDLGEVRVDVGYTRRESSVTDAQGNRINTARIAVGGFVKEVVRG